MPPIGNGAGEIPRRRLARVDEDGAGQKSGEEGGETDEMGASHEENVGRAGEQRGDGAGGLSEGVPVGAPLFRQGDEGGTGEGENAGHGRRFLDRRLVPTGANRRLGGDHGDATVGASAGGTLRGTLHHAKQRDGGVGNEGERRAGNGAAGGKQSAHAQTAEKDEGVEKEAAHLLVRSCAEGEVDGVPEKAKVSVGEEAAQVVPATLYPTALT